MPWELLPLLPLLTYYGRIAEGIEIWPACLLVPAAAWLGRRFGTPGIVVTAIGALAALLPLYQTDGGEFGGAPEVYVIALWVAIAAAARDPLQALIGTGSVFRKPAVFVLLLALLPLSIGLGALELEDGGRLSFYLGFRPLFLFALLLFGLADFPPRFAALGLVVATTAGAAIRHLQLDAALSAAIGAQVDPGAAWFNGFNLSYRWDDLAGLLTGLACFHAGRTLMEWRAGRHDGAGFWRQPYLAIGGLTIVALAGTLVRQLPVLLPAEVDFLGLHGDYYALLIASFIAGFLRHHLGVAAALGLLLVLLAASNAAAFMLGQGGLSLAVEQPLLVLAYGIVGLRLRDLLDGKTTAFAAKGWVQYALLVVAGLSIVTSISDLLDLAQAVLVAIGAAIFAGIVQWLRRRWVLAGIRITGEGWLLLAVLLAATVFLVLNLRPIMAMLTEALDDLDLPAGMIAAGTLVLLNVPVAFLVAGYAKCLPKVWNDLKAIRAGAGGA